MIIKELNQILEEEKDIIPFLKKLTNEDKKALVPTLKKLHKKLNDGTYREVEKNTYRFVYNIKSENQRDFIEIACYVCLNKTDALRILNPGRLSVSDFYLENIIPWYVPTWFSDVINEEEPYQLDYLRMMDLHRKGLLNPSRNLIVSKLVNAIHYWDKDTKDYINTLENLEKYPETLNEHIWYLFEQESEINWMGRWGGGRKNWVDVFKEYSESKQINREKLLKATINTATKGFNKTLSGWFMDLLMELNPTEKELLNLQGELFSALNSPHSKVVNTVLKYFKTLVVHKAFKVNIFIENASILLNSATKSVVTSTLMIFEKMAKSHSNLQHDICLKSCEALVNTDEKIQLRASKIIEKFTKNKAELSEEISMYADNLYASSKEILKDFIEEETEMIDDFEVEKIQLLSDENRIETYETLDDLIFFVSQAIDNNEVYHIDLLLSYLPKLNVFINEENVSKLEPILKRAFDFSVKTDWSKKVGELEVKVSKLINDFGEILIEKYPTQLSHFIDFKNKEIEKIRAIDWLAKRKSYLIERIPLEKRELPLDYNRVHYLLFRKSKELLSKNLDLSLLSMPTHSPCWIDPITLIQRIHNYEKANVEIDIYDFQVAMGRLPMGNIPATLSEKIKTIKDKELQQVFAYHFDVESLKKENIKTPELWLQSVLCRDILEEIQLFEDYVKVSLQKEQGLYDWYCEQSVRTYEDWNYRTQKKEEKKVVDKELYLKITYENPVDAIKKAKIKSIYNHYVFSKNRWETGVFPHDAIKLLLLSPNNPGPFLNQMIYQYLYESYLWEVDEKLVTESLAKTLYEIWNQQNFNENTYLFVATTFLCNSKTAREFSAELWIKTVAQDTINNHLLGKVLGKLEHQEYGALKRFTDLIVSNMFNISKKHNEKLLLLLDGMLSEMNEVPIRGVKKLLELFNELKIQLSDDEISQPTQQKLRVWKEVKSLKNLVNKILG